MIVWLISAAAGSAQQDSAPAAEPGSGRFPDHDQVAVCGSGKKGSQGCIAIKARPILDAASAPWSAIGRVNFASIQTRQHCTGTLVSERVVLTAAHCLYHHARKKWIPADSLRFVAGYQRGNYKAVSRGVRYILDPDQDGASRDFKGNVEKDWALLLLQDPIGQTTGYLPLADIDIRDAPLGRFSLAGYSGLRPEVLSAAEDCSPPNARGPQNVLVQRCSVMQGDSGAPLLMEQDGDLMVIGLLSAVANTRLGLRSLGVPVARFDHALRSLIAEGN